MTDTEEGTVVAPPPLIATVEPLLILPLPVTVTVSVTEGDDDSAPRNDDEPDEIEEEGEFVTVTVPDQESVVPTTESVLLPAVVTLDRKEILLQRAREDRLAWIHSVPLPYSTPNQNTALEATHILPELPSVTKVLSHLYGTNNIAARVDDIISQQDPMGRHDALRDAHEWLDVELQRAVAAGEKDVPILLADYRTFLAQLERPESAVIVNAMRHGQSQLRVAASAAAATRRDTAEALRNQIGSTVEQFKRLGGDDGWTVRSLESFLYGQAQHIIQASLVNEKERDRELWEKLKMLDFVSAKNFDLTCFDNENNNYLEPAVSSLQSLQTYFSPFEKLQRILQVYHSINSALTKAQGGKIPSADDILPTLIWVVLQAKPPHLLSNLAIIEAYASPAYLRGEAGYAFTNLYGAVQFLVDLDLSYSDAESMTSLTMTPQEFRLGLENSRASIETKLDASIEMELVAPKVEPAKSVDIPVSEVRAARLRGEVVDLTWARRQFLSISDTTQHVDTARELNALPRGLTRNYSFLTVRPEDVRLKDLPQLLQEYKMLVHATETLLAERSERTARARKERLAKDETVYLENAIVAELELLAEGRRK